MSEITAAAKKHDLTVYIPDTRGVTVSQYGKGNLKIGLGVYTYSRLPGHPSANALGSGDGRQAHGTCPGATEECQRICYAARPVTEQGAVYRMWKRNASPNVPPIPEDCRLLRIHVSGDFDTADYIDGWIVRLTARPDVTAWAYTRSWRVPALLIALERLRALPNIQLFASMDKSTPELPPTGWRRAWINDDVRLSGTPMSGSFEWSERNQLVWASQEHRWTDPIGRSFICPEETKHQPNCEACRYCFDGKRNDVTFLKH